MELLTEHLGHGLGLALAISLPCVLTAAGVGLVVGILQAVTQVQEQTIAAAPKILAVFLILLLGGGLMMTLLTSYVRESVHLAFNEIPKHGDFLLPPREEGPDQARARAFFQTQLSGGGGSRSLGQSGGGAREGFGQPANTPGQVIAPTGKAQSRLGTSEQLRLEQTQGKQH